MKSIVAVDFLNDKFNIISRHIIFARHRQYLCTLGKGTAAFAGIIFCITLTVKNFV